MRHQVTFGRAAGRPSSEIDEQNAQIDRVEAQAMSLGFAPLRKRKTKRRDGIGECMPGATIIIKTVLDDEVMYRLLSAVAHGHTWAISQLFYTESSGDDMKVGATDARALRKQIKIDVLALATQCAVKAFLRALWNQCQFYGWDCDKFEEVFEDIADRLQFAKPRRF